jgi:iron complex outermembrane receptor protein
MANWVKNRRDERLICFCRDSAQIPSSLGATAFAENPQQATFTCKASKGFEANNSTLIGISYAHEFAPKL